MTKDLKSSKIFVVEDDPFYIELITHLLATQGCQDVSTFSKSVDCINNLHKMPDLCILDYNLEEGTGMDVLLHIKSINPDIQVIFLSGQEAVNVALDTLKHGAFDYIIKNENAMERLTLVLHKIEKLKESSGRKENKYILNAGMTLAVSILLVVVMAILFSH
jgi:two-component system, NtrC family, response regulator AtoC